MNFRNVRFHFVGVGGIGMSGLAEIFLQLGAVVSGSDLKESSVTRELQKKGLSFFLGHKRENISYNVQVVVHTSAVRKDNPEILEAQVQKIPIITRAEALSEIMRLKRGIAIAGSHGKTTTTSLAATLFLTAETKPTVVVGGRLPSLYASACWGDGDFLIAEADESDGSFLRLNPEVAVITNIDNDHLDFHGSIENLEKSFLQFADRVPFYGSVLICGDDLRLQNLFQGFRKRVFTYGRSPSCDLQIFSESVQPFGGLTHFSIRLSQRVQNFLGQHLSLFEPTLSFAMKLPGEHNILNATAAVGSALMVGLSCESIQRGLLAFQGVDRRFHFQKQFRGCQIFDDYGHHPTEILATLKMFRQQFPEYHLHVVFQPHRFSRTRDTWGDMLNAFGLADQVTITDTYSAGEAPMPGFGSLDLLENLKHSNKFFLPKSEWRRLQRQMRSNSVLLLLGAGDINLACEHWDEEMPAAEML